jgi:hypothetical protein
MSNTPPTAAAESLNTCSSLKAWGSTYRRPNASATYAYTRKYP